MIIKSVHLWILENRKINLPSYFSSDNLRLTYRFFDALTGDLSHELRWQSLVSLRKQSDYSLSSFHELQTSSSVGGMMSPTIFLYTSNNENWMLHQKFEENRFFLPNLIIFRSPTKQLEEHAIRATFWGFLVEYTLRFMPRCFPDNITSSKCKTYQCVKKNQIID